MSTADSNQAAPSSGGTLLTAVQVEVGRMKASEGTDSAAGGKCARADLGRLAVLSVKDNSYSSSSDLIRTSIRSSDSFVKPESHSSVWLERGCIAATAVSLCSVYKLPTFVNGNYPGESLIAYLLLMVLVGLPVLVLEMASGQFARAGIFKSWRAVPLFKGIGMAQLMVGFYAACYFPALMTWAFQFSVIGMANWNACTNSSTALPSDVTVEEQCFQQQVLHSDTGQFNYAMLAMLALAVAIPAMSAACGAKFTKWAAVVSAACTFALLIASLASALAHHEAALDGIRLLTPTDWSAFARPEVWHGAAVQTLSSVLAGFGTIPSLKCSSSFRTDVIREGVALWCVHLSCGLLSVLTVFAWVGVGGRSVARPSGAIFLFRVLYHTAGSLTTPAAFAIVFLAGFNALLPVFYALAHNLLGHYPTLRSSKRRWITCCVLGLCLWLVNVAGVSPIGEWVVLMWDSYAIASAVVTFAIFHLIGWTWLYGGRNLRKDFEIMIERSISIAWPASWNMAIVILLAAQLWRFADLPLDDDRGGRHPVWTVALGWSLYLLPFAVSLIFMSASVYRQVDYEWWKKVAGSVRPARDWGPDDPLHRLVWLKNRRRQVQQFYQPPPAAAQQSPTLPPAERVSISISRVPYQREYVQSP